MKYISFLRKAALLLCAFGCLFLLCACAGSTAALLLPDDGQVSAEVTPTPAADPTPSPTSAPTERPAAELRDEAKAEAKPTEETTVPEASDPTEQAIRDCSVSGDTTQIVLVVDHNLTAWQKNDDGSWTKQMDVYCGYGSNGLADADTRIEGSRTTPIGAFPLLFAFGIAENPGTAMDYRNVTSQSYWSAESDTYNTWVESSSYVYGEHLIDYYQYEYCLAVGFNIDPVVYGRGSAIFVHCKSTDHWSTAGCVSLYESDMVTLLQWVKNGAYIIIVPDLASVSQY